METNHKTVLVVDNDEILRNGMRLILEADNFRVEEAGDGREAMKLLESENFNLIISDFEMPEIDGIQLFTYVKNKTKSRFLLLSEFSTALQAKQAYQLGVDEFLNKPFTRADFVKAVGSAFSDADSKTEEAVGQDYIQVPLTDFITGSTLKVDLFLKISATKYLKIGNKGGNLDQSQLEAYVKKGLNWLYMRKKDFAYYVGFNIAIAQQLHSEQKIACARKIRLTMHVTETLIAQLRRAGLDRQQLEETSNVVINAVELIMSSNDTIKLLESMEVGGTLPAHSIAVSIWACLIAKQLGWTGHSTYFKIAICALFHDIGSKEIDENLFNKPRFELTRQEQKVIETHTVRGRDILQSVPGMINDAAIVALQHHELYRGGGYPYGLKFQQIHPLAALIGLSDRLCEILKDSEKDAGIGAAFEQLHSNSRDFETEFFGALMQIVRNANIKSGGKAA